MGEFGLAVLAAALPLPCSFPPPDLVLALSGILRWEALLGLGPLGLLLALGGALNPAAPPCPDSLPAAGYSESKIFGSGKTEF